MGKYKEVLVLIGMLTLVVDLLILLSAAADNILSPGLIARVLFSSGIAAMCMATISGLVFWGQSLSQRLGVVRSSPLLFFGIFLLATAISGPFVGLGINSFLMSVFVAVAFTAIIAIH